MSTQRQPAGRPGPPIRLVLVNDYEIIVRGLAAMLEPHGDRVVVVDVDIGGSIGDHDAPTPLADVALFDTFAGLRQSLDRARSLIDDGIVGHVVIYTWDAPHLFVAAARDAGVHGIVLKGRTNEELVSAIERVVAGERVGFEAERSEAESSESERAARPDPFHAELSEREREVLALVARGLTNREIATELYLSIDTVKTYMRRLFVKLEVSNRSQAAVLAVEQGVGSPR